MLSYSELYNWTYLSLQHILGQDKQENFCDLENLFTQVLIKILKNEFQNEGPNKGLKMLLDLLDVNNILEYVNFALQKKPALVESYWKLMGIQVNPLMLRGYYKKNKNFVADEERILDIDACKNLEKNDHYDFLIEDNYRFDIKNCPGKHKFIHHCFSDEYLLIYSLYKQGNDKLPDEIIKYIYRTLFLRLKNAILEQDVFPSTKKQFELAMKHKSKIIFLMPNCSEREILYFLETRYNYELKGIIFVARDNYAKYLSLSTLSDNFANRAPIHSDLCGLNRIEDIKKYADIQIEGTKIFVHSTGFIAAGTTKKDIINIYNYKRAKEDCVYMDSDFYKESMNALKINSN